MTNLHVKDIDRSAETVRLAHGDNEMLVSMAALVRATTTALAGLNATAGNSARPWRDDEEAWALERAGDGWSAEDIGMMLGTPADIARERVRDRMARCLAESDAEEPF